MPPRPRPRTLKSSFSFPWGSCLYFMLELEEKERQLQNIPQEIIDRYNSGETNSKKMEDIAYE